MSPTLTRPMAKAAVLVLAYTISFGLAYAFITYLQKRLVISQAVNISKAYWDEEKRQNNKRLFGSEDAD